MKIGNIISDKEVASKSGLLDMAKAVKDLKLSKNDKVIFFRMNSAVCSLVVPRSVIQATISGSSYGKLIGHLNQRLSEEVSILSKEVLSTVPKDGSGVSTKVLNMVNSLNLSKVIDKATTMGQQLLNDEEKIQNIRRVASKRVKSTLSVNREGASESELDELQEEHILTAIEQEVEKETADSIMNLLEEANPGALTSLGNIIFDFIKKRPDIVASLSGYFMGRDAVSFYGKDFKLIPLFFDLAEAFLSLTHTSDSAFKEAKSRLKKNSPVKNYSLAYLSRSRNEDQFRSLPLMIDAREVFIDPRFDLKQEVKGNLLPTLPTFSDDLEIKVEREANDDLEESEDKGDIREDKQKVIAGLFSLDGKPVTEEDLDTARSSESEYFVTSLMSASFLTVLAQRCSRKVFNSTGAVKEGCFLPEGAKDYLTSFVEEDYDFEVNLDDPTLDSKLLEFFLDKRLGSMISGDSPVSVESSFWILALMLKMLEVESMSKEGVDNQLTKRISDFLDLSDESSTFIVINCFEQNYLSQRNALIKQSFGKVPSSVLTTFAVNNGKAVATFDSILKLTTGTLSSVISSVAKKFAKQDVGSSSTMGEDQNSHFKNFFS